MLQLIPFNSETLSEDMKRLVADDFPEEKREHQLALYVEHFNEYRALRWDQAIQHYLADGVPKMEKLVALAEAGYARGEDDLRVVVLTNTDCLSRIKSRVQEFLTTIERGYSPIPPGRPRT